MTAIWAGRAFWFTVGFVMGGAIVVNLLIDW